MTPDTTEQKGRTIVVNFLARGQTAPDPVRFVRQLPADRTVGGCRFVLDPDARHYDWLVVYDDVPGAGVARALGNSVPLNCARQNTLLITGEPSSVNIYGRAFLGQFGHVLSSQERWAIRHPGHIHAHCGLMWFYGIGSEHVRTLDEIAANPPLDKRRTISTVCSSKRQTHTLHNLRYEFTQKLAERIPELEIFGHGVRPMDDKAEALDAYRYHVAIENHIAPHHWTEKLSDAFLGCTLPFYAGAPDAADDFPAESFIAIDLFDLKRSAALIRDAIDRNLYEARLPAILEARRRVIEAHGLFPNLARHIRRLHRPGLEPSGGVMMSKRAIRRAAPASAVLDLVTRAWVQIDNRRALARRLAQLRRNAAR